MDTEQVQANQAEAGEPVGVKTWPANLYHEDAYKWIAYMPCSGQGILAETVYVLNRRNAEAPDTIKLPITSAGTTFRRLRTTVAPGRAAKTGDFCMVQVGDGEIQVLVAHQDSKWGDTEAVPALRDNKTDTPTLGPGRYNHREAFCLIQYRCKRPSKDTLAVNIWNSRDGKVPEKVSPYLDMLTYEREPCSEVCKPDYIPEAGSLVFEDADHRGTPKVAVATVAWLDQFRKKYANPQNTIKRLEGAAEAAKKNAGQMERDYKLLLNDKDEQIRKLRAEIGSLQAERTNLGSAMNARLEQINQQKNTIVEQDTEIARLKRFEQLAVDFATAVNQTSGMLCSLVESVKDFTPKVYHEMENHPETFAG